MIYNVQNSDSYTILNFIEDVAFPTYVNVCPAKDSRALDVSTTLQYDHRDTINSTNTDHNGRAV
jgi:hypothetical protein